MCKPQRCRCHLEFVYPNEKIQEFCNRYDGFGKGSACGKQCSLHEDDCKDNSALQPTGIGLRGHRELERSLNKGNFMEILQLVALHDKSVQDRLRQGPRNCMYTSPEIQNSLLHVMGEMVRKKICESVQQAGWFTLMADESKDCSKFQQLAIVFRYADVDTGTVYERFLTYVEADNCIATSLTSYIKEVLDKYQIEPCKMVCQCCDGASVMSGSCSGIQRQVKEFASTCRVHSLLCSLP